MAPHSSTAIAPLLWSADRIAEGIESLSRQSGFLARSSRIRASIPHPSPTDTALFDRWIQSIASNLHVEAEPVISSYGELHTFWRKSGPAIVTIPSPDPADEPRFLLVLRGGLQSLTVLTPELTRRKIATRVVQQTITASLEEPYSERIAHMLEHGHVNKQQHERVRTTILGRWLANQRIAAGWLIRLAPGASMWKHLRHMHIPSYALGMVGAMGVRHLLEILTWWIVGQMVFRAHVDHTWFVVLALLLFTTIPFHMLEYSLFYYGNALLGVLLRHRLMQGTLRLDPEEVRHQGAGQFLGLVMDLEMIEQFALAGGFYIVSTLVKLVCAVVILAIGAGGMMHALLLVVWFSLALLLTRFSYHRNDEWIAAHREMSNDLAEHMVGHRTRLAQQAESQWHGEEDRAWTNYFHLAQRLDRIALYVYSALPNCWIIVGVGTLIPAFIWQQAHPASIAISLGGVLLSHEALRLISVGFQNGVQALVAWKQIAPLVQAATRTPQPSSLDIGMLTSMREQATNSSEAILVADDLVFSYPHRPTPVLTKCTLAIHPGDRILLEGPSGSGKSTLAAIISGLRTPQSGLMLLRNYDRTTVGDREWRRRIVAAPQFHENHVLTETLAFNLLMGRRWPPTAQDFADAEDVCLELGLGDLLARMPSGLQQIVGEGGWQLSHGERSRLYIARALLQHADVIILDESFAALDPENLERALRCVFRRAPALLVIAHP